MGFACSGVLKSELSVGRIVELNGASGAATEIKWLEFGLRRGWLKLFDVRRLDQLFDVEVQRRFSWVSPKAKTEPSDWMTPNRLLRLRLLSRRSLNSREQKARMRSTTRSRVDRKESKQVRPWRSMIFSSELRVNFTNWGKSLLSIPTKSPVPSTIIPDKLPSGRGNELHCYEIQT